MRTEIILQHGWGFDGHGWSQWLPTLQKEFGCQVIIGERGYFGDQMTAPRFSKEASHRIIVAHSLGLHCLEETTILQADAVMLIGGFAAFHPNEQLASRRSKRVIRSMMEKLLTDPKQVVADFHKNCFAPECASIGCRTLSVEQFKIERLITDLDLLDCSVLGENVLKGMKDVTILQGDEDHIVSPLKASELSCLLPQSRLFSIAEASHALPFTQTEKCLFILEEAVLKPLALSDRIDNALPTHGN